MLYVCPRKSYLKKKNRFNKQFVIYVKICATIILKRYEVVILAKNKLKN